MFKLAIKQKCIAINFTKLQMIARGNTMLQPLCKMTFCDKMKKEEILLYIMQDKYSVRPDKEFRINHTTLEKKISPDAPPTTEETVDISSPKATPIVPKFKPHKVVSYGKHSITEISTLKFRIECMKTSVKRKFMNKICPRDYPYSVKQGYAGFSNYTFLSNVSFNAMNFVTTQVLINSLNLNISKSAGVVFSAGMNWAIKEGIGQMGKLKYEKF